MRYLLDTNIVGQLMRAHPVALERLARHGTDRVFISAITEAEICFGLAKRPAAARLHRAVEVLREQVEVLDFTARTALVYGSLRALISATALEHRQDDADIVFVTSDHAFSRIPGLIVEDWTVEACGEGQ